MRGTEDYCRGHHGTCIRIAFWYYRVCSMFGTPFEYLASCPLFTGHSFTQNACWKDYGSELEGVSQLYDLPHGQAGIVFHCNGRTHNNQIFLSMQSCGAKAKHSPAHGKQHKNSSFVSKHSWHTHDWFVYAMCVCVHSLADVYWCLGFLAGGNMAE